MSLLILRYQQSCLQAQAQGGQVLSWTTQLPTGEIQDLLYQGSSFKRSGIPILFPFADPLEGGVLKYSGQSIPQHGFGRLQTWKISQTTEHSGIMSLDYQDLDAVWQEAFPFDFQVEIRLKLLSVDSLSYGLKVGNRDTKPMPIAPGIHPYFPIKHQHKSEIHVKNLPNPILESIDWEQDSTGTHLPMQNPMEVVLKDRTISFEQSSLEFTRLVVWSQPLQSQDYNFVCLEPFSRPTNGINTDPIWIQPGESWQAEVTIKV